MAVSQISICNSALVKVGADRISSISQNVKRAELLNAIWDEVLDSVQRARKWNFCRYRTTLAPTGTEPDHGYSYAYDLPSDYLGHPETLDDGVTFEIEGTQILTDESELEIIYNRRNTDPSSWDSLFAESMAYKLASQIAFALSGNRNLANDLEIKYQKSLGEAASINGMEDTQPSFIANTWAQARRGRRW